jgi:hypothetical protein
MNRERDRNDQTNQADSPPNESQPIPKASGIPPDPNSGIVREGIHEEPPRNASDIAATAKTTSQEAKTRLPRWWWIVQGVYSGLTLLILYQQANIMQKQATIMEQQTIIMTDSVNATREADRPLLAYVGSLSFERPKEFHDPFRAMLTVSNAGRSPAKIFSCAIGAHGQPPDSPFQRDFVGPGVRTKVLLPGDQTICYFDFDWGYMQGISYDIGEKGHQFYVYGTILYTDARTGKFYYTMTCFQRSSFEPAFFLQERDTYIPGPPECEDIR